MSPSEISSIKDKQPHVFASAALLLEKWRHIALCWAELTPSHYTDAGADTFIIHKNKLTYYTCWL